MTAHISPRTQAALEQISEDESLISDVTDTTATAVINWLTEQITAAGDQDDATFEQTATQLRRIARCAARASADDPATFLAKANAQWAASAPAGPETTPASLPAPSDPPAAAEALPTKHDPAPVAAAPPAISGETPAAQASPPAAPTKDPQPSNDVAGERSTSIVAAAAPSAPPSDADHQVEGERSTTAPGPSATEHAAPERGAAQASIGARATVQGDVEASGTASASADRPRRRRRRGRR